MFVLVAHTLEISHIWWNWGSFHIYWPFCMISYIMLFKYHFVAFRSSWYIPDGLLWWLSGKVSACNAEDAGLIPGSISRRRKRQSTPLVLPGKSHGQRTLVGYSPWGCKELDRTYQPNNNISWIIIIWTWYIYFRYFYPVCPVVFSFCSWHLFSHKAYIILVSELTTFSIRVCIF